MCVDWVGLWDACFRAVNPPPGSITQPRSGGGAGGGKPVRDESSSDSDLGVTNECLAELLKQISSGDVRCQRDAARQLRQFTKESPDRTILTGKREFISLLVKLLRNRDPEIREHAVTALLNLSMDNNANKEAIVHAGAVDAITEVLKSGSMEARENSAATLVSLSVVDENKAVIGESGALPPLVDLLRDGTMRGRHDAASAIFHLSLLSQNGPKLVSAGILPQLVELLGDPTTGMLDVSLAILSLLVANEECIGAIGDASTIPILIGLLKSGSSGKKERALVVLLALSESSLTQARLVRNLGALPPLVEIAKCGTPSSRRTASQLLDCLNNMEQDSQ